MEDSVSSQVDPARDSGRGLGRWLRVAEWMLLVVLVAHFCMRNAPRVWTELNNDFPDYFVTASLLHEHYDTSRVYEWVWLGRQKDRLDIQHRVVNLAPSTTFSTLAFYPFTGMPILAAKRCWIILNFGLLLGTLWLLRDMTHLPWLRLALVTALSMPLRTNFLTGQYYVLLLSVLTLACFLYLRQRRLLAGVMVGIAAGMKIYPAIYLIYFLRKRDLRAFAGGVTGALGSAIVAVLAFGWQANRMFAMQVLPATLRGESNAPYALKLASLPALLHRLFVYEPQLNPHPALHAAWLLAVLEPVLQMTVMAPALLLAAPNENGSRQVQLEWAAILVASLAVSTSPQGYLFTLLILPACMFLGMLRGSKNYLAAAMVLVLYFLAGYLSGSSHGGEGWSALLGVPRLCILLLCCALIYAVLMRQKTAGQSKRDRLAWAVVLGAVVVLIISANLRHQRGLYDDYRWRIFTPGNMYIATRPATEGDAVLYAGLTIDGYRAVMQPGGREQDGATQFSGISPDDVLAVTAAQGERWAERAGHESNIVSGMVTGNVPGAASASVVGLQGGSIPQAELPVASFDGRWLAFLREDHGRARLWLHALGQPDDADRPVTPLEVNVMEMSFLPTGEIIFSASTGGPPGLFTTEEIGSWAGKIRSLGTEEARYPAVSPDGRWLAYGQFEGGNWNLRLRDLKSGQRQRLTDAECNTMEPAWTADSKTLVYTSDCGRGLLSSALSRRQVVP